MQVDVIRRVAHQAARHRVVPVSEHGGQPVLQAELGQRSGVAADRRGQHGRLDENRSDATVRHLRERAFESATVFTPTVRS